MRIKERYQLAAELGERYWAAGRRERGSMLDAFCLTTGYSRKYAIGMLRGRQRKSRVVRKPRRRRYGKAFQSDLGVLWEAAGYICAERLGPFLPDLLQLLEKHRQLSPSPQTRALLLAASTSTISRNLAQLPRQARRPRPALPQRRQPPRGAEERLPGAALAQQLSPGQRRAAGLAGSALYRSPPPLQQLLPAGDARPRANSGRGALTAAPRHPSDPAP